MAWPFCFQENNNAIILTLGPCHIRHFTDNQFQAIQFQAISKKTAVGCLQVACKSCFVWQGLCDKFAQHTLLHYFFFVHHRDTMQNKKSEVRCPMHIISHCVITSRNSDVALISEKTDDILFQVSLLELCYCSMLEQTKLSQDIA